MPYQIAIGQSSPWLLPNSYSELGSAISDAKTLFQALGGKAQISVYEGGERGFSHARSLCVARINKRSTDGLHNYATIDDYPEQKYPQHTDNPEPDVINTIEELTTIADASTGAANEEYFGQFVGDGQYTVDYCGDTVRVLYDVDDNQDHRNPLAIGALGVNVTPPFRWKFKAVPVGRDETVIAYSEPGAPTYTFTGLIPGLAYTFYYSDEAEEIDAL